MGDVVPFPIKGIVMDVSFSEEIWNELVKLADSYQVPIAEVIAIAIGRLKWAEEIKSQGGKIIVERGKIFKRRAEVIIC